MFCMLYPDLGFSTWGVDGVVVAWSWGFETSWLLENLNLEHWNLGGCLPACPPPNRQAIRQQPPQYTSGSPRTAPSATAPPSARRLNKVSAWACNALAPSAPLPPPLAATTRLVAAAVPLPPARGPPRVPQLIRQLCRRRASAYHHARARHSCGGSGSAGHCD